MSAERPIFSSEPIRSVTQEATPAQRPAEEKNGQTYFWDNVVSFPKSWDVPNKQTLIFPAAPTGKALMTAFFVLEMLDTLMTESEFGLINNGQEVSPLGGADLYQRYNPQDIIALKLGLTAVAIIAYGLTSIHDRKASLPLLGTVRFKHATEVSLQVMTVFQAGVLSWNTVNFIPDFITKIKS